MTTVAISNIQLGKESSGAQGTAVAATIALKGVFGFGKDDRKHTLTGENLMTGQLTPADEGYIASLKATLELDGEVTFQGILYPLTSGIAPVGSPTVVNVAAYKYAPTFPVTTNLYLIDTFTAETDGIDASAQQIPFCYTESLEISGKPDDALKMKWKMGGSKMVDLAGGKTASLAYLKYEAVLFNTGKIYIDSTVGGIGTTQKAKAIVDFNLKVNTGLSLHSGLDGVLESTRLRRARPKVELDLTFDTDDATFITERNNYRNRVNRIIRLSFTGINIIASSSPAIPSSLQFDMNGLYESFDKLGNGIAGGGTAYVKCKFVSRRQTTDGTNLFFTPTVINDMATLL